MTSPGPTAPQPQTRPSEPASEPAAKQFSDWLTAFNSADRAVIAAYRGKSFAEHVENWPPLDEELQFSDQTGGFVVVKTEEQTSTKYVAIVKERGSDQHARAVMEIDAAPPHLVRKFDVRAIPTPDELLPPRLSEAQALEVLGAEIDKQVAADEFSGVVLVAKNGTAIFVKAYGFADREKKLANTIDTRFRIGSMNKMFTSVALLQLVQAGKVKLDAPIGTYLTAYPNKNVATKVTPHHLLSHTGGTGDIFGPEFEKKRLELRTHNNYLELYGARDLGHEPGAKFQYSNYGFVLAGAIIEKVTRKTYYDAVAAKVYKPAGMKGTASPPEEKGEAGRVVPYMRETRKSPWTSAANTLPWRGTAAGGGDSTVTDLLAFANALTSHTLLDAKHFELATTSKAPPPGAVPYGYGFGWEQIAGVRCVGHGGGAPGMNGQLYICDSGYTIAVLANLDPPAAGRLASMAAARLPAQ